METKKKVGVITFHNYDNYGAILQSYALQKKLQEIGTDPEIMDYRCDYIGHPFRLRNLKNKGVFNYIYGVFGHICYLPRRRKCNKFRKYMTYSDKATKKDMSAVQDKYDIYISGSDQVWDHKLTNFDKSYFLDFVGEDKKLCSYAASIGENLPPEELRPEYTTLLKRFDNIIVREDYGADVVEQLIGKRPDVAVDPTLLLTANEWNEVLKEPKRKDKYILVYQLGINKEIVDFVRKLKKKTGLKVIYIPFPLVGLMSCSMKIAIGPAEWIGLFKHAEYVATDSFHGAVFALLFNKKFFAMVTGHHTNKRVKQLLNRIKLTERTMETVTDEHLLDEIDFTYANEQLNLMRQESMELLKNMVK